MVKLKFEFSLSISTQFDFYQHQGVNIIYYVFLLRLDDIMSKYILHVCGVHVHRTL